MRIAYLISEYLSGYHSYLVREVRTLRSKGLDIYVVSIRPADRPFSTLTPVEQEEAATTDVVKEIPLWNVLAIHCETAIRRPAGYLRGLLAALRLSGLSARRLLYYLCYFGEAVVAGHWIKAKGLTHFHVQYSSTVGLLITKVFPLTMSLTLHGSGEFVDPRGFHVAEKVAAATFVCAVSQFGRSRILNSCAPSDWSKVEVVHLGVDSDEFAPGVFRASPETFHVISVGRLVKLKALPILLNAVARLVREGRRVMIHLAGEGPEQDYLQESAARVGLERLVVFEGYVDQPRLRELYRSADLLVMPSFDEGVPVVLMEAMAAQVPCVATRITGIPELIRDEVDGLLVAPSDEEALAAAIRRCVDDPELRRRLGQAGRKRVREVFDLERNCGTLAEIFRRRLSAADSSVGTPE